MIDFDEELKKYKPITEVKDVEESVRNKDMTDMIDIMKEMMGLPSDIGDMLQ